MTALKLVAPTQPNYETISNLKHLGVIIKEFSMTDTIDEVDRDGVFQTLGDLVRIEAEKIEDFYDTANTPNWGGLDGK